ncbi:MAG: hypothetical protein GF364_04910 [Candidatus Lokiarchaeota archaeon]|nr:hypothetical protein [Candidatus Lokiarchaeota archaeon]
MSFSTSSSGTISVDQISQTTGLSGCLNVFQIETDANIEGLIQIQLFYSESRLDALNMDASNLTIYHYNEAEDQWEILDTTINGAECCLEVTVSHFSIFAVALTPEPEGMSLWIWTLIAGVIAAGALVGVYFTYHASLIKTYRGRFSDFKERVDQEQKKQMKSDNEEQIDEENVVEDKEVESSSEDREIEALQKQVEEIDTLKIEELDIPLNIAPQITKKDLIQQFKVDEKIKELKDNLAENERMFQSRYIESAVYRDNLKIISRNINKILDESYKPLIDDIEKTKQELLEDVYKNLELIIMFNPTQTQYIKKFGSAPTDDDTVKAHLSILKNLVIKNMDFKGLEKCFLIDGEPHYYALIKLETKLYMVMISKKYPLDIYKQNFRQFCELAKKRIIYIKQIPVAINKFIGRFMVDPKTLKQIEFEDTPIHAMKKCPICGKLNPPSAKVCMNDGIKLIF